LKFKGKSTIFPLPDNRNPETENRITENRIFILRDYFSPKKFPPEDFDRKIAPKKQKPFFLAIFLLTKAVGHSNMGLEKTMRSEGGEIKTGKRTS